MWVSPLKPVRIFFLILYLSHNTYSASAFRDSVLPNVEVRVTHIIMSNDIVLFVQSPSPVLSRKKEIRKDKFYSWRERGWEWEWERQRIPFPTQRGESKGAHTEGEWFQKDCLWACPSNSGIDWEGASSEACSSLLPSSFWPPSANICCTEWIPLFTQTPPTPTPACLLLDTFVQMTKHCCPRGFHFKCLVPD